MRVRPPSAAVSLYPHLKTGTPDVVQQREFVSVADAMFPHLKPSVPKATPVVQAYREPEISLVQRCDENPWLEHGLAMSGLKRVR